MAGLWAVAIDGSRRALTRSRLRRLAALSRRSPPPDWSPSSRRSGLGVRPASRIEEKGDLIMSEVTAFVGLDVHKETLSVSIAGIGRLGEVRHLGNISNTPEAIAKLARRLGRQHGAIEFVYEAGCCGYNIQRQLTELGFVCRICAPSMTPRKPGERIKNDTRDAVTLARLLRAGELTYVWVPDTLHEALRDLVRARHAACMDVRRARTRIQAFLLRNDLRFAGKPWSYRHRMWLCNRRFDHPAQQIAFQTYLNALEHEEQRKAQLDQQIAEVIRQSPWAKLVVALQALKGVGPTVAATVIAEVGDFTRFQHPRQLVAYFGLAPGEHSSGGTVRPRGITKAGNTTARSILCEAAWNYRTTPKVGQWMKQHRPAVPQGVVNIAWKAQLRLHKTYRRLTSRGKRSVVATAAVARELLCFMWSIAQMVPPSS
jgi:transposase